MLYLYPHKKGYCLKNDASSPVKFWKGDPYAEHSRMSSLIPKDQKI